MNTDLVPTHPGVYLFKNKEGEIIYVGKAKNLKNRVRSYFDSSQKSAKTHVLVKNIAQMDHIIVDNEVEALLLENQLIKRHQPKYNIALKDDKSYAYIKVTKETYPIVISTRRKTRKGEFFGPFTDGFARKTLVDLLNKHYKLCTKKDRKKGPCLNYHLGLCSGACCKEVSKEEYAKQVENARKVLKGNIKQIEEELEEQMQVASKKNQYEEALLKRNQLSALAILKEKQKVTLDKSYDQDVIAMHISQEKAIFSIFSINKGVLSTKKSQILPVEENIFEKFLTQYYLTHVIPGEIIVSSAFWEDENQKEVLEEYFTRIKGTKVQLTNPMQGEKKKLLDLVNKNIQTRTNKALDTLKEELSLAKYPKIIECFDISNLKNQYIVGAMTRFIEGKEDKSNYRKFAIKSTQTQDDFASMYEVVFRRYKRLRDEKLEFPDLVVIDGGKGQLGAAKLALKRIGVSLEIFGLAKEEETIIFEDHQIQLDKNAPAMLLLRKIRDTTHRFVLSYNKQLRRGGLRR